MCKIAKTVPIFKNESRVFYNNYRLTLFFPISKKLLKVIHIRLIKFLEENNCFYDFHFWLRLNFSINTALMSVIESIQNKIDQDEYLAGVLVDLEKAFDTVDHDILINKLEHYGIRGVTKELLC